MRFTTGGLISLCTPFDPYAEPYPVVMLPDTPEWRAIGTRVLVVHDPSELIAMVADLVIAADALRDQQAMPDSRNALFDSAIKAGKDWLEKSESWTGPPTSDPPASP